MRFAADLHLHSRYASAVSPAMTLENIARWAQRKGVDLLSTGDCLQANWLQEIEATLEEDGPGWFKLKPAVAEKVAATLPAVLRRELRFVLGTEVSCAPPGTPRLGGVHCLIFFPSLDSVRRFREKVQPYGDLTEGRPELALTPRQLLELVLAHDPACHFAPAHVFNPWYSALGTVSGGRTLDEVFGDLAPRMLAVETGLTSTPAMCRRVGSMDRHALFSCSDAHSLENLGRECTVLQIEPSYAALFAALWSGSSTQVIRTVKFPLVRTRYYLNRCGPCAESFEGSTCPQCGRPLVMGARDRLAVVATRESPQYPDNAPPFTEFLPLHYLLAELTGHPQDGVQVRKLQERMLATGSERYLLTEASSDEIEQVSSPGVARAILAQRAGKYDFTPPVKKSKPVEEPVQQTGFDFGLG
jgi:PHP family Zn ribbon phosphoesterase